MYRCIVRCDVGAYHQLVSLSAETASANERLQARGALTQTSQKAIALYGPTSTSYSGIIKNQNVFGGHLFEDYLSEPFLVSSAKTILPLISDHLRASYALQTDLHQKGRQADAIDDFVTLCRDVSVRCMDDCNWSSSLRLNQLLFEAVARQPGADVACLSVHDQDIERHVRASHLLLKAVCFSILLSIRFMLVICVRRV